MNSVGVGKRFEGQAELDVTEKTYKDRNVNFRKYVKGLMLGILAHNDYKTLNLERKKYKIAVGVAIFPEENAYISVAEQKRKIEEAKKKIDKAKNKLIKVVK